MAGCARRRLVLLWWLVFAALASCQAETSVPITRSLTLTEFRIEPARLTAPVGRRLRLAVTNTGRLEHELVVRTFPAGQASAPAGSAEGELRLPLDAGQAGALEFRPVSRGRYELSCGLPGHRESGERGELVVE